MGIYDDGDGNGLAAGVRTNIPEEAVLVDLDTGEVQSSGDRYVCSFDKLLLLRCIIQYHIMEYYVCHHHLVTLFLNGN